MIEALFNQAGYLGAKRMLDAAAVRHEAIAANIANAETPHYRRVDLALSFRSELRNAITRGDAASLNSIQADVAVDTRALPVNRDGNTVKLEHEMIELSQNSMQHAV